MTESLKYYYDGQNVIAEYDNADVIQRRYIHGTQRIDERAKLRRDHCLVSQPTFALSFFFS